MLLFVSETQAAKASSVMACGQQVFDIMLWKDGIFKRVCMAVFCVLQGSIMISQV